MGKEWLLRGVEGSPGKWWFVWGTAPFQTVDSHWSSNSLTLRTQLLCRSSHHICVCGVCVCVMSILITTYISHVYVYVYVQNKLLFHCEWYRKLYWKLYTSQLRVSSLFVYFSLLKQYKTSFPTCWYAPLCGVFLPDTDGSMYAFPKWGLITLELDPTLFLFALQGQTSRPCWCWVFRVDFCGALVGTATSHTHRMVF